MDYLSPEELVDPKHFSIRADIYSLGCVLYHCLTGEPPFAEGTGIQQILRKQTEMPRPLKEFDLGFPDLLQEILNKMLATDPAERFVSPRQAAEALEGFLILIVDIPTPSGS
jgi:serine/threonine-protein kinase